MDTFLFKLSNLKVSVFTFSLKPLFNNYVTLATATSLELGSLYFIESYNLIIGK